MTISARRVAEWPPVERLIGSVLCGRRLRPTLLFLASQLFRRKALARYRLRETGVALHLRHSTPDVFSFDQAFCRQEFEWPDEVANSIHELGRPLRVVDLGAYIGLFGVHVLGKAAVASITAFEPEPGNAEVVRRTIAANADRAEWKLVQACAATAEGVVPFVFGAFGRSHTAAAGERAQTATIAARDVFPHLGGADLVKIDIEGSEWEILADPRFRDVPAVAIHLEYHARLCPEPDPQVYAASLLQEAGFAVRSILESSPGNGILWAWRERLPT